MDMKEILKLNKIKIIILILTFIIVFFVRFDALLQPCNWRVCPDFIQSSFVLIYPNFYKPAGCGYGIGYICWSSSWSFLILIKDILAWIVLNFAIFLLMQARKQNWWTYNHVLLRSLRKLRLITYVILNFCERLKRYGALALTIKVQNICGWTTRSNQQDY